MSETHPDPEYIVEYADGPLAGTAERRYLVGGKADERLSVVAAVEGLESLFWYVAGEERTVNGERHVTYRFDAVDSDPVEADRDDRNRSSRPSRVRAGDRRRFRSSARSRVRA